MTKTTRATAFSMMLLVVALGSAHADEAKITPEEIKSAWVGKKLLVRLPTNRNSSGYVHADWSLKADGTAELNGNGWGHVGSWRLSSDGYCTKYPTIRPEERCFTAVKTGSTITIYGPDNSMAAEILKVTDL